MNHIQTLTDHLTACLNGEPTPGLDSDDAAQIMNALAAIAGNSQDVERLGLQVMRLISDRLRAGLIGERELTIIQSEGGRLC